MPPLRYVSLRGDVRLNRAGRLKYFLEGLRTPLGYTCSSIALSVALDDQIDSESKCSILKIHYRGIYLSLHHSQWYCRIKSGRSPKVVRVEKVIRLEVILLFISFGGASKSAVFGKLYS
jgi:hypothetical protein